MKSKTSFFNKGIFVNSLKRFSWIGIFYSIALFLIVPMKILMYHDNDFKYINRPFNNIFNFNPEIQALLILTVPVITAMALFTYLHSKKLGDLIHSLPIKRERIYDNNIVIGMMILIIPLIINGITLIILNFSLDLGKYYNVKDVLIWISVASTMNVTVFLASVFVGMNTGILIGQGILTYVALFLPVGLFLLLGYNVQLFLYGFSSQYYFIKNIELLSPITRAFELWNKRYPMTLTEVFVYILISIVLYFLAKYLYKIRKVESYSNAIAFSALRPVFKYGITFCTMLLGGAYFGQSQNSIKWALFGYFIASLVGYLIAQMILKKSLYVFKDMKGYFVYSIVIILILVGSKFDMFGYEKYIPKSEDINKVYFNEYGYYEDEESKAQFYSDRKNIENIKALHNKIIKDKNNNYIVDEENTRDMTFVYELKNGKRLVRSYETSYKKHYDYIRPIYESNEYKKVNFEIFRIDYDDIDRVLVSAAVDGSKRIALVEYDEIKDAIESLKEDINNETYDEMPHKKEPLGYVTIFLSNSKEVHVQWNKDYDNFENWLDRKGYLENVKVLPKEVRHVIVEKRSSNDVYSIEENKSSDSLKITDKNQIDTCLKNYTQRINKESQYIVGFYLDNGDIISATFDNSNVPDFVKDYFNK